MRTWRHCRRGLITGIIIWENDTWARIQLSGDHRLRYKSERLRDRRDGELVTVRKQFLTEIEGDAS